VRRALCPEAGSVNESTTQLTLELELDGDSISGNAIDAGGERHHFSGWIGLMGVLDALLDRARPDGGADISSQH
jgi:hypothetical protein